MGVCQVADDDADALGCGKLDRRPGHRKVAGDVRFAREDFVEEDGSVFDGEEVKQVLELGVQ